jgi:hypothetical protein
LSAPVVCDPVIAMLPDQPPEAVQLVALLDDHCSVELAPLVSVLGLAVNLTVGVGAADVTETITDWFALPPVPVQVRE